MKDEELIVVRNRNNGSTGYTLPDSNIRRFFTPGESKKIPLAELRALQYAPGGDYILRNLLIVENAAALDDLNMKVEPEYFYTEKEIRKLLFENNNMDAFLDFLDFATSGALEIAKDIAVKEQVPDMRKREALSKKTGFNINNAIMVNEALKDEEKENAEAPSKERRVKPTVTEESATPQRRTAPLDVQKSSPKYNVVTNLK